MHAKLTPLAAAALALGLAIVGVPDALAQQTRVIQDDDWCHRQYDDDHDRYCEVREFTLADRDLIAVDGRANGGIRVEGWNRNEILVRAKVQAHAHSESEAREMAGEVEIETSGREIRSDGPRTGRHEWWSVSYELMVPRESNLDLKTVNGGIKIEGVSGRINFRATNGGIGLSGLGGDVSGSTTNGGLSIHLTGSEWDGDRLDVKTTNGGVKIRIPSGYSAELESGTVNGSLRVDFPITIQGRIDRRIRAELGSGGRPIRAVTTNGGVVISRV